MDGEEGDFGEWTLVDKQAQKRNKSIKRREAKLKEEVNTKKKTQSQFKKEEEKIKQEKKQFELEYKKMKEIMDKKQMNEEKDDKEDDIRRNVDIENKTMYQAFKGDGGDVSDGRGGKKGIEKKKGRKKKKKKKVVENGDDFINKDSVFHVVSCIDCRNLLDCFDDFKRRYPNNHKVQLMKIAEVVEEIFLNTDNKIERSDYLKVLLESDNDFDVPYSFLSYDVCKCFDDFFSETKGKLLERNDVNEKEIFGDFFRFLLRNLVDARNTSAAGSSVVGIGIKLLFQVFLRCNEVVDCIYDDLNSFVLGFEDGFDSFLFWMLAQFPPYRSLSILLHSSLFDFAIPPLHKGKKKKLPVFDKDKSLPVLDCLLHVTSRCSSSRSDPSLFPEQSFAIGCLERALNFWFDVSQLDKSTKSDSSIKALALAKVLSDLSSSSSVLFFKPTSKLVSSLLQMIHRAQQQHQREKEEFFTSFFIASLTADPRLFSAWSDSYPNHVSTSVFLIRRIAQEITREETTRSYRKSLNEFAYRISLVNRKILQSSEIPPDSSQNKKRSKKKKGGSVDTRKEEAMKDALRDVALSCEHTIALLLQNGLLTDDTSAEHWGYLQRHYAPSKQQSCFSFWKVSFTLLAIFWAVLGSSYLGLSVCCFDSTCHESLEDILSQYPTLSEFVNCSLIS